MCFISTRIPLQTSGDAVSMVLENLKSGGTLHTDAKFPNTLLIFMRILFSGRG